MAKDYTCWDCGYYGGRHEPTCPRKGYLNPSAPPAAAPTPAIRVECPCGIHRDDCEYHRPQPPAAPTYEYGAYDMAHVRIHDRIGVWFAAEAAPGASRGRIVAAVWT